MRNTIIILIISLFAVSCGKDKYTSAPQIKFKSVDPNVVRRGITSIDPNLPVFTINVTDKEGDLGYIDGTDTSFIVIKNSLINHTDTFRFPDMRSVSIKNFQADIRINSFNILRGSSPPPPSGKADTLYFDIYVIDFAKNKSNVITTEPLYYVTP
ncbi:MAG: hypothetical protein ABI760_21570 [Ferruginibacter sp.]